jgi:uncharacterized protein YndB with AHSA1/START domain
MESAAVLSLESCLPASAQELFDAWMDGDRLATWFHLAPGIAPVRAEVDAAPAGGFTLAYDVPPGFQVVLRGRWRVLQPAQRIEFDLDIQTPEGTSSSRVAVEFQPGGGTTKVRLRHHGLADAARSQVTGVWRHGMRRMVAACPTSLDSFFGRLRDRPGFRSRFGGLWPDAPDAEARLAGKRESGLLDDADAERFRHWRQHGYVRLEGAVSHDLVDRFRAEIADDWRRGNPDLTIELNDGSDAFPRMAPQYEHLPHKVLDYHSASSIARDIQFAPAIRRFLEQLFERPPMAFQSLLFKYGTEQDMHQDTAYVVVQSPMEFVGCWVALEDVVPGSGELQYYGGSHRIPEYLWLDRGRACPPGYGDHAPFLRWMHSEPQRAGCPLIRFHPKKGDALIWHADLVHGGSKREQADRTRWSFVSHFCPVDVDPEWMARVSHSGRLEHAPGCHYCFAHRATTDAAS